MNRNDPALLAVQKKYHLPYRFLLSLGTFEPRKNLGSLLSAFEAFQATALGELSKYELVIAGAPGWKGDSLRMRIADSPAQKKIHLIGCVAEEDKPALYALAAVFVYPSFYEGFGFPPLEALSMGIPVIASHSASLPEVIGNAGVLIDPYRPDELLMALREVLGDRELHEDLRQAALEQRTKFSWRRSAEALKQQFSREG
jgi:glycosyltransferase involved in cell wall biosynthesis